jgi:uncharacterized protein (TIRG00374 family)
MKKISSALLKAAVTVLLFYFIFRKTDFHQFGTTLRNARLDILLAAFLILWLGHYICIFRWRMLMQPLMPVLSRTHLFLIYCIGLFFNLTFPTVVGGDVVKFYYAGKPSKRYAQSFAATFLDRDAGMFAMMIIACVVLLLYPVTVPRIPVAIIVWGAFAVFLIGNIAIFTPRLHQILVRLLNLAKLNRIAAKIDAISNAFQIMSKHRMVLVVSLLISLINQILVISVTWVTAIGLRLNIPASHFFIFVPVITLISMIPISLNGMGLREYAYLSLFQSLGIHPASCFALGLVSSLLIILSSLPGGVIYIFFRNRSDLQNIAALETDFS